MTRILAGLTALIAFVVQPLQLQAVDPLTLVGQLSVSGGAFTTDVWGWIDPATQKQYALLGNNNSGLHIIDVSDPGNPQIASIVTTVPSFDVKSWSTYAYTTDGNVGLDGGIVDISTPTSPVVVNTFPKAHNIYIDLRGIMFACGPGLRIYLLNGVETTPIQVFEDLGTEGHDAMVHGLTLYFFAGIDGTFIYDASGPATPTLLGSITDPNIVYHHNGWTTHDGNYLVISDELATGTTPDFTIWDVSNPATPVKVSHWNDPNASIHNAFRSGNYLFTSYYSAGFRVFDIANPTTPFLAAEYDLSASSGEGIMGTFGCYPFTQSGHIFVSDRPGGFFVFDFDDQAVGIASVFAPRFELNAAYPNPSTSPTLSFELEQGAYVRMEIFNVRGQRVTTLLDRFVPAGPGATQWLGVDDDGRSVPSGVYFARMTSHGQTHSQRIVLVR